MNIDLVLIETCYKEKNWLKTEIYKQSTTNAHNTRIVKVLIQSQKEKSDTHSIAADEKQKTESSFKFFEQISFCHENSVDNIVSKKCPDTGFCGTSGRDMTSLKMVVALNLVFVQISSNMAVSYLVRSILMI